MKVEMGGVGRGIGAGPSLGASRIGSSTGMRPMGFAGAEAPRSMMSMGARTLSKAWSPINIGRVESRPGSMFRTEARPMWGNEVKFNPASVVAEKGTNRPFLAPREPKMTPFVRKPMDNIQIRNTIQRRLQGARYLGAPEVMTNKGIENIQRVSTPDKRAMRVLSLVGSRMPFAVSRENPATTLNLAQKKTESPKGMEVVFPSQTNPKPEIRMGQVTNPVTAPVVSTETAQALKTVLAMKKAGMVDQARKVAQNIKPEQRNIAQVAKVVESMTEETVKKLVEVKNTKREKEENTDSQKGLKKFRLVRDERAFRARVEIVVKAVKRLFGRNKTITGRDVLAEVPSGNVNKDLKSEVVKESNRNDHTWETYIPADLRAQKFESEAQALESIGLSLEKHEPVTIAENGKKVGVDALRKVHNPDNEVLRSVSDFDEEIVFKTEQVQRSQKETVWVDDEVVSKTLTSEQEEKVEEPKAKLDLVKLGIMPVLNELLKIEA